MHKSKYAHRLQLNYFMHARCSDDADGDGNNDDRIIRKMYNLSNAICLLHAYSLIE